MDATVTVMIRLLLNGATLCFVNSIHDIKPFSIATDVTIASAEPI